MKAVLPKVDIARIAANAKGYAQSLVYRGDINGEERVATVLRLAESRKAALKAVDEINAKRNKGEAVDKTALVQAKATLDSIETDFHSFCLALPNWTHPDVPIGEEANAKIVRESIAPISGIGKPMQHTDILERFDLADFNAATKTTGTKFVFLKREAALLEMALQRLATENCIRKHSFVPVSAPDIVKPWIIEACGFQPRGESSQIYHLEGHDLCLAGTSEITLAGYLAGSRLTAEQRLLGISHCFRTEAGSTGKESKGLYRLHQFSKAEMFVACEPENSEKLHDELVQASVDLCEMLGLQWRILDMPTLELGASAYRKFDVEVYMPGMKRWGEVASVTNTTDFQSRRLDIKMNGKYAHTLNGTACAVPRILLALLETHQKDNGQVSIPPCLAAICGFDVIRKAKQ